MRWVWTIGGILVGWLPVGIPVTFVVSALVYYAGGSEDVNRVVSALTILACFVGGGVVGWLIGNARHKKRLDQTGSRGNPSGSSAARPGWHADPTGRHQLRYWDGSDWTEHVQTQGRPAVDPMKPTA